MKVMVLNPPTDQAQNVVRDMLYNCWCRGKRIANAESPPVNSLYIATVLKKAGIDTEFVDAVALYKTRAEFIESMKEGYDYVVISTASMTFKEDVDTLKKIKEKYPDTKTIIFGSHATFYPEDVLKTSEVDFIILGEAEYPVRDLLLGKDKIKSLGYKENGRLHINKERYYVQNLDELPFPDWTMFPKDIVYFHPLIERIPWTTAISSRGCMGKCNFCISPFFFGKYRQRSARNVVDEMEYLTELGYKEVFYRDETFTVSRKRLADICNGIIERGIDITWICNARVDTVDKEIMALMKKAGCHTVKFGVESGDQRILDNIQKGITLEQTKEAFRAAREAGMKTHGHFMLGCIGETKETLQKTIDFAKEIKPTTVTFNVFTPFSGTPVYNMVLEKLKKEGVDGSEIDLSVEHSKAYYNELFTELTNEEVTSALRRAYREFYLRPAYFWDRLKMIRSFKRLKTDVKNALAILAFISGSD